MRFWWQLSNSKVLSRGQTLAPCLLESILMTGAGFNTSTSGLHFCITWGCQGYWDARIFGHRVFQNCHWIVINIRHSDSSLCMDHFLQIHLRRNSQYINFPNGAQQWQGLMRRLHNGLIFHLSHYTSIEFTGPDNTRQQRSFLSLSLASQKAGGLLKIHFQTYSHKVHIRILEDPWAVSFGIFQIYKMHPYFYTLL